MMSSTFDATNQFDIGIVGCGASGLYLANMIAMERGDLSIAIFERNEKGAKKLDLTGNGRCNFTNAHQDRNCYYSEELDRAYEFLQRFPFEKCLSFYSELGIAYCEREGYYYPLTGMAETVSKTLLKVTDRKNVTVLFKTQIHGIDKVCDRFEIHDITGSAYSCRNLVIASGGLAAPATGSHGDAYYWLKGFDIKVNDRFPALVPLIYADHTLDMLDCCRVKAKVTYRDRCEYGEVQFAKGHISGIPVLSLSRLASKDLLNCKRATIHLDILQAVNADCLETVKNSAGINDSNIRFCLCGLFSDKLLSYLSYVSEISLDQRSSAELINRILDRARDIAIEITKSEEYAKAQVTGGGVALSSLDEHLMARNTHGLYCIGEVVDVDGICGGYNLQWAFASAAACADRLTHI